MTDEKKAAGTMPVLLLKNYRPADGNKTLAGTKMDLPIKEARGLIEAGIAERADPLPEA